MVTEEFFDESMMGGDMMGGDMMGGDMMEGEQTGPKKGLLAAIVVGVIVAAGVGLGAFLHIRKKRKAAKLLADELADLEKEISAESDERYNN